ncbi:fructosamine kinase family protein [Niveibacterium sp. SC-1]|uniref:fructosamine kinase family protein n=1 Tax=Niveibacterium sp. SC-1 TaxID=3135646 RepID=UPI00311FBF7F
MAPPAVFAEWIGGALAHTLGSGTRVSSVEPVAGNSRQTHWHLTLSDGSRLFAKSAPGGSDAFAAEADGLEALRRCSAFAIPRVIALIEEAGHAVLLLEHLALRRLDVASSKRFGEALAQLHAIEGTHFGWARDNYVGASPQSNAAQAHWPIFFAQHRLAPQFATAATKGYRGMLQEHGERIHDKIGAFFLGYQPKASLVHGDLWSGNVGVLDSGMPAIFDPAVYLGDREVDLAMSELFGGFPNSFYLAYREAAPLDPGYEARKQLYNLYHILNHLNLFGASYLRQAERMAKTLFDHLRN